MNSSRKNNLFKRIRLFLPATLLSGILFLAAASPQAAQSVTLAWNGSSGPSLAGYRVHEGTSTGTYTKTIDVGNHTQATILDLTAGQTYYFVVGAYNTAGVESAYSNEIRFTATATTHAALTRDANVSRDQSTAAITTPAFSTTSGNELLLAFISTDYLSGPNTTVTGVSGGGLNWVLVQRTNVQSGTSEIWRAFATSALSNVTVTATLSQSVSSSLTVMSFAGVDTTGTNGSGAIGATGSSNASSGAQTASLTTTRNGSWVMGVGNDFDGAIARNVGPNQTMVHQYLTPPGYWVDTFWVQMYSAPTPTSGTTVTINDTAPTYDRYNLSICEVLPAGSVP
jgi:hypothetical protein